MIKYGISKGIEVHGYIILPKPTTQFPKRNQQSKRTFLINTNQKESENLLINKDNISTKLERPGNKSATNTTSHDHHPFTMPT